MFVIRQRTVPLVSNKCVYLSLAKYSSAAVAEGVQNASPLETKHKKQNFVNNLRLSYPEFLPDPNISLRNVIREKLERNDMISRRAQINIPEFYVGSILAVTASDVHATGKTSRFVGICIDRERCGLHTRFILRNVIDHQGVEVLYDLYDPTIQQIEVLRLEKRLDNKLYYLRDALPEYSTFDENMKPEIHADDQDVPMNDVKVTLKPRPWLERWERQGLNGVANIDEYCTDKMRNRIDKVKPVLDKFDLMQHYRRTIPEEEQNQIYSQVYSHLQQLEMTKQKSKSKKTFVKPKKLA